MKKKYLLLFFAFTLILPAFSFGVATHTSLSASSGIISIPSADTIKDKSILMGMWLLMEEDKGFLPRVLVSFIPRWEIGAGLDIQNGVENSWIFNTKYKIYDAKSVNVALGFNYQVNGGPEWDDNPNHNQQIFAAFTWHGWAKTSSYIGKTFGDNQVDDYIDFGIGIEKDIWSGKFGGLALIFDFSNTTYRWYKAPMKGAGEVERGIFNGGVRFGAFEKKLTVDVVWMDVLDESRSWAFSGSYNLQF